MQQTDNIIYLNRKAWIIMANDQLKKRWPVCDGCLEILMCSGPVSPQICQTLDEMVTSGMVTGRKKIPWNRSRIKFLPVSKECLVAYGVKAKGGKLISIDES